MNFVKKLWDLIFHTEKGLYLVFGALTTVVSYIVYALCVWLGMDALLATVLQNAAGILFAYFTNRGIVFGSKAVGKEKTVEFVKFVSSRLITLGLNLGIIYLTVNLCGMNEYLAGALANVVVIIVNYVLSKLIVFRS